MASPARTKSRVSNELTRASTNRSLGIGVSQALGELPMGRPLSPVDGGELPGLHGGVGPPLMSGAGTPVPRGGAGTPV